MKGKIFNAQEVQAILNGSKVMFREVIKKPLKDFNNIKINQDGELSAYNKTKGWYEELKNIKCPYQVGQKIFVKETFSYSNQPWCDKTIFYKASHGDRIQHTFSVSQRENKWRSPMVMQEYDSRLTPLIKEIRVERLQDISEDDAYKEGVQITDEWTGCADDLDFTGAFKFSWNATHKKPEEKFEANPWVWVCTMEVVK